MIEGGCLCGALRYQISGEPQSIGHCHCRTCQRASGAAFVTWAGVAADQFTWTQGKPAIFNSSEAADRGFCGGCGTPITFQYRDDRRFQEIDVALCSFDDPDRFTPSYHIWTMSQRQWIHLQDSLPRYVDEGGDRSD